MVSTGFLGFWRGFQSALRRIQIKKPDPQASSFKEYRWMPFRERLEIDRCLPAPSLLISEVIASESAHACEQLLFLCCSLLDLMAFRARWLGGPSLR